MPFNAIQPTLLHEKLQKMKVDASTTSWIIDYQTDRTQFLRLRGYVSEQVVRSTVALKGTVLSPCIHQTSKTTQSCHLHNCSDAFAVVGCVSGLPACLGKPLQMIQNVAARLVFNQPKKTHVTPLLIELHWLPVAARIKFKLLMLAYRVLAGSAPTYLNALVRANGTPRTRGGRYGQNLLSQYL